MSEYTTKETCEVYHKQLDDTVTKLCNKIDNLIDLSAKHEKEIYLHSHEIKEQKKDIDTVGDKVRVLENDTLKHKMLFRYVPISLSLITIIVVFVDKFVG